MPLRDPLMATTSSAPISMVAPAARHRRSAARHSVPGTANTAINASVLAWPIGAARRGASPTGDRSSGNTRLASAHASTGIPATATPTASRRAGSRVATPTAIPRVSAANPIATLLVASHARSGADAHVTDSADHATSAAIAPTPSAAGPPHDLRRDTTTAPSASSAAPTNPHARAVAPAPAGRRPRSIAPSVILSNAQPASATTDSQVTTLAS